ncbi:MAG: DUF6427 family protein [Bacteroidales bacterium]|jgi:hypothetical protein|nr:DUF6427 family protein [Bacteroidales bacterium]
MVLKLIKSNHPFNFLLLVLFGTVFWSDSLINPKSYLFYESDENNILFYPIYSLLGDFALPGVIIALILMLALSIFIQQINSQYLVIRERNKLPALIFVIMAGGLTSIHTLHPVYFAGIFLILAIYRLFSIFDNEKPYSACFDSGFLLGIGSLFYINLLLLIPVFIMSVGILSKKNGWKIFVIQLIGILLPFIFVFSFGALTNRFFETFKVFEQNIAISNNHFETSIFMQVYLGFLTVLTIISCIIIMIHYNTKKISSRKFFSVFFLILIFSVTGFVFVPSISHEMLIITFIPLSYLISNLLTDLKSRFWSGLIFILLLVVVIFLQIMALFG